MKVGSSRLTARVRSASVISRTLPENRTLSFLSLEPIPVAMTVTLSSSPILSSRTAPQMISASSPASAWIRSEACVISVMVSFGPQVMFIRTPRAPVMETSSRSGWETAFSAASNARFSPLAIPVPMMARPAFPMVVLTSAKSRLTSPGIMIRSVIPFTAWRRTWSAFLNISIMVALLDANPRSLSLGMVITVSTTFFRASRPASACFIRFLPSKPKGFVTTATVRAPTSLLASAITGAAPVPVPPPRPAVIKTMWLSSTALRIASMFSMAACRPISGFAPAPRPSVSFSPIWIFTGALDTSRAWRSVLADMNFTP